MGFDSFWVPDWAKPYVGWAVGMDWPEGDESRCFRLADACAATARKVAGEGPLSSQGPLRASPAGAVQWDGEALKAFAEHVKLVPGGRQAELVDRLVAAALELNNAGVQVEYTKKMIVVSIWFLIFQIGWLLAASMGPWGGVSLALIGARVQLTRMTIRQIGIRLLINMGLFGGIVAGLDLGVQASQARRDGIDWEQVGASAEMGALAGALLTGVSAGLSQLSTAGLQAGLSRAEMTVFEKVLAASTKSVWGMMGQSGAANGLAGAINLGMNGQFDWDLVFKNTVAGVVGGADAHWAGWNPSWRTAGADGPGDVRGSGGGSHPGPDPSPNPGSGPRPDSHAVPEGDSSVPLRRDRLAEVDSAGLEPMAGRLPDHHDPAATQARTASDGNTRQEGGMEPAPQQVRHPVAEPAPRVAAEPVPRAADGSARSADGSTTKHATPERVEADGATPRTQPNLDERLNHGKTVGGRERDAGPAPVRHPPDPPGIPSPARAAEPVSRPASIPALLPDGSLSTDPARPVPSADPQVTAGVGDPPSHTAPVPSDGSIRTSSPDTPGVPPADAQSARSGSELSGADRHAHDSAHFALFNERHMPPAKVGEVWDSLTPSQRELSMLIQGARIGALDGIPVAARDQVNRPVLADLKTRLIAERDRIEALPTTDRAETKRLEKRLRRLNDKLNGIHAIEERLAVPPSAAQPRPYLLMVSNMGPGCAIVAVGDPDTAANVATFVPGTRSRVGLMDLYLKRADAMWLSATKAGSPSTSVIMWMGYRAPQTITTEAGSARFAEFAVDRLNRFQDGLRVTHDGPRSHNTVIGHSYGATVVGYAGRDGVLNADDVVFLASPGVGVKHAGQLRLTDVDPADVSGRVHASVARHDFIKLVARHGPAPDLPPFGGNRFTSSSEPGRRYDVPRKGIHSGYWEPGSDALVNLGRLIAGLPSF
ncbi:alpha/beta hydrolase [Streptosporangium sp. NBC_01639]|uniref:alpha/beta hydrolase n=1 Tax=Streptosporangium sp. NBC_01639 TaxID=2975948 RepID=UPI00386DA56F|nr:alpha/beta hydrolase [Streptosporangium sp. NBC_01639]